MLIGSDPQARRAKLLSYILFTLIALCAVTIAFVIIAGFGGQRVRIFYIILISSLIAVLALALFLNRKGRYTISAVMLIVCAYVIPWMSAIYSQTVQVNDFVPVIFSSLTILLCALLLSLRVTIIFTVLQIASYTALLLAEPDFTIFDWQSLLVFLIFSSTLGIMYGYVNQKDYKQIEEMARKLKENESKLKEMSVRDDLTGLFNRRFMVESLDREIRRSTRNGMPISVVMMDVNDFKQVNDRYGHVAGDTVLAQIGVFLKSNIRAGDIACRYGGDEFVMILPETPLEVAHERTVEVLEDMKAIQFRIGGDRSISMTVSLGVAVYPQNGATSKELLELADAEMYRAKRNRKSQTDIEI